MKVNNSINQVGRLDLTIQILRNNENKYIAYKYDGTNVYQAWLIPIDNNYEVETDSIKILAELDNVSTCLKRRWRNQSKPASIILDLDAKLDQAIADYQAQNP